MSTLDTSYPQSEITTSGYIVTISVLYNDSQKIGVWVLVGAAGASLLAVLALLTILAISAYKTLRAPSEHRFMRTHVMAYFISLLLCDAISAVGSLMNAYWVSRGGVFLGTFCTSQGALKNTGNVGTALWSMVIAIHTFCLLFLKWRSRDYTLYATLFVVWSFIGLVVIIGPTTVRNLVTKGPYFGVSGYWCWITDGYTVPRVTLEYFWMFLSALVSFLLYTVVFLSLRGNLVISGGRLCLRFRRSTSVWESQLGTYSPDGQVMSLAKQMLAYPIAYIALVLPISVCRFLEWAGHKIPFGVIIFADAVFLLSGLVNAILFTTTRKLVPTRGARGLFSRSKSLRSDVESQRSNTPIITPYFAAEKLPVSPVKTEQEILVVNVSLPAPTIQKPPSRRSLDIKRGVPLTPTDISIYSQNSPRESIVAHPPAMGPGPQTGPTRIAVRQSIVAPLNVVRNVSLRKVPDVPVEANEWSDVDVGESYSRSLRHSKFPINALPPLPRSSSTRLSQPKVVVPLTPSQRSRSLGNWF